MMAELRASLQYSALSIQHFRSRFRDSDVRNRTLQWHQSTASFGPLSRLFERVFGRNVLVACGLDHAPANMNSTCAVQPRILVADDQPDLIDALRLLLKREDIHVDSVGSPEAALSAISAGSFDLLLMDLNYTGDTTSGREGIDLLSRVQAIDRELPIVVMTGWGSVDIAVEAMRHGVRNFVQKPWDNAQLVAILRAEVEAGRARRQQVALERRDLDEARRIQRKLLPSTMPPIEGWEVAVSWQPASGVGGDCFDAIAFGPGRVGLSIADVVGKGIPAALLMSNLQAAVRAFATNTTEPAELCQQVNRILCGHIAEGRFISFFYCIIDSDDATLTFANAGHYPPILIRADGTVERLGTGRRGPRGISGRHLRPGPRRRSVPAIGSSSTPTASPMSATPPTRSSATAGSSTWQSPIAAAAHQPSRLAWPMRPTPSRMAVFRTMPRSS